MEDVTWKKNFIKKKYMIGVDGGANLKILFRQEVGKQLAEKLTINLKIIIMAILGNQMEMIFIVVK